MPPTLGEAIDDPTSNDEHVAQLLSREARDKSLKYSALGLQAYLPRRYVRRPQSLENLVTNKRNLQAHGQSSQTQYTIPEEYSQRHG
jgi:hypothetical protein